MIDGHDRWAWSMAMKAERYSIDLFKVEMKSQCHLNLLVAITWSYALLLFFCIWNGGVGRGGGVAWVKVAFCIGSSQIEETFRYLHTCRPPDCTVVPEYLIIMNKCPLSLSEVCMSSIGISQRRINRVDNSSISMYLQWLAESTIYIVIHLSQNNPNNHPEADTFMLKESKAAWNCRKHPGPALAPLFAHSYLP